MRLVTTPKGRTLEGIAYGDNDSAQITIGDNTRTYRDPQHAVTVSVERDGIDWDGRDRFRWEIAGSTTTGPIYAKGDDLYGGVNLDVDAGEMLETLLGFLGACGESVNYGGGENADLFPAEVGRWAAQHDCEISMSSLEDDMAECETCGEPIDYCQGHGEIG